MILVARRTDALKTVTDASMEELERLSCVT